MDGETQVVREMWWEDKDLHVITTDGKHSIYRGAQIISLTNDGYKTSPGLAKVEEVSVALEHVRLYSLDDLKPEEMKGAGDEFGGTDFPEVPL